MNNYFKIRDIRKFKILDKAFLSIIIFSAIGVLLFDMFLMPSKYSSGEIKVLFFITFFPKWLQYSIVYSIIIFPLAFFFKFLSRYSNKGVIYFDDMNIRIKTRSRDVTIAVRDINRIIFVDKENFFSQNQVCIFVIITKWSKIYRIKLLEEERMDELVNHIEIYLNETIKINETDLDPTDLDD